MKTVYISSPYSSGGKLQNTLQSIATAEVLVKYEFLPFVPLLAHFWNEYFPHDYEYWMKMDEEWVTRCDVFLRLPGESVGADREEKIARDHNIPVYYNWLNLVHSEARPE